MFNKNEHTQVPLLDRSAPFMNDIVISKDGVIKLLKGSDEMQYDAYDVRLPIHQP